MFKTPKGQETRRRILQAALALFRAHGFDETTMRDIARAADLSPGASYHYFASKEAIVLAYYAEVQAEHARRVAASLREERGIRPRLGAVIHTKLDIVRDDRRLLGVVTRYAGEPSHELSFLGPATRDVRLSSMQLFGAALAVRHMPAELRRLAAVAFWALHMGLLLYLVYDDSPGQERTRRLADGALDVAVRLLTLARSPLLRPMVRRVTKLLDAAGLLIDDDALAFKEPEVDPEESNDGP